MSLRSVVGSAFQNVLPACPSKGGYPEKLFNHVGATGQQKERL
jgi:hypothetical protein